MTTRKLSRRLTVQTWPWVRGSRRVSPRWLSSRYHLVL
ncbi:unnamed protein product [Callosobruchus maculatus]|uniref:Uncharacterized protein n=1 Tax=Callosobruchus maculatus TaxID=64391 RepID=A0A653BIP1_CALMS|nr:unnamed protein product [Callosobruchus maculatus]